MDSIENYMMTRPPTSNRPLLGLTVLAVEDSRFASEALRLLCLRSGARIRRADSLHHARRHLRVYRPSVVLVDLGLPDGSGANLIAELANAHPRVDVLLGMSGDPDAHDIAIKAGADGFLAKPIRSIGAFQTEILNCLPPDRHPKGLRALSSDIVEPDQIALRDDLMAAAQALDAGEQDLSSLKYLTQFLGSVAQISSDTSLSRAVEQLRARQLDGKSTDQQQARLSAMLKERLTEAHPL